MPSLTCSAVQVGPAFRAVTGDVLDYDDVMAKFNDMMDKELIASITVYRSDYGNLKLIPNRRQRERDMFFLSPGYFGVKTLEPMRRQELGLTGLQRKGQIWMNKTLQVHNEAAHGVLADLLTAII